MSGRRVRLESSVTSELEDGGRILVSRLQYLGDVVMSLSLVQRLQEHFPQAEIDYLTRADGADILAGEPLIRSVHCVPQGVGSQWQLIRDMRKRRYALAIDLFSNPRSALLTWLSGARMRVGGDRRGRRHFYTHPVTVPRTTRAATEFHLHYARPVGVDAVPTRPALHISERERKAAADMLRELGVNLDAPVVGIHPGGKWEVKRWPAAHYAALAGRLSATYGMQVVMLSGPDDRAHRDAVMAAAGRDNITVVPTQSIRGTAAVVHALDGVVVNDGGIMHVAVAVGTPTVGVFGSAEPDIWFPYEKFGSYRAAWVPIACRPCHSHTCLNPSHLSCLQDLTVEQVEHMLLSILRDGAAKEEIS